MYESYTFNYLFNCQFMAYNTCIRNRRRYYVYDGMERRSSLCFFQVILFFNFQQNKIFQLIFVSFQKPTQIPHINRVYHLHPKELHLIHLF